MKKTEKSLDRKIECIVYLLIVNFIFVLSQIFIPFVRKIFAGRKLFLLPFVTFSFFGFLLVYLLRKAKVQGKLGKNLNLAGYSAGLIFVSVALHNIVSGIGTIFINGGFEEPLFFILATIVLPALFIIGVVRSVLIIRQN